MNEMLNDLKIIVSGLEERYNKYENDPNDFYEQGELFAGRWIVHILKKFIKRYEEK